MSEESDMEKAIKNLRYNVERKWQKWTSCLVPDLRGKALKTYH